MEKPKIKLIGEDGNIFNLLAVARKRFRELKQETGDNTYQQQWEELYDLVTESENYQEALLKFMDFFDIE